MGSPEGMGDLDEHPQRNRAIAAPFAVGAYEITFAEWDACVAAGKCPFIVDAILQAYQNSSKMSRCETLILG